MTRNTLIAIIAALVIALGIHVWREMSAPSGAEIPGDENGPSATTN